MINQIYLRRKNKLILTKGNDHTPNLHYIATILANFESLGYTFSKSIIDTLYTYSANQLNEFYLSTIDNLKELLGANKTYKPMYPNFPQQVMEASDAELFVNALIHYLSEGTILPEYEQQTRLPLYDRTEQKVIALGSTDDFLMIFRNLLSSKTSLSATDKADLEYAFSSFPEMAWQLIPREVPLKESIALLGKLLLENNLDHKILFQYVKTATDVLRIAVSLSDGDVSLAASTRFKSFKRKERRLLLTLLENCGNIEEDMKRYKNRWIRLGERLHPGEYKQFKKANEAFFKLRNNEHIPTFNGLVAEALCTKRMDDAMTFLSERPGEFARKLDHLLRLHHQPEIVIENFKAIAEKVETTVLLQVREHFKNRNAGNEKRSFFPKGNVAKMFVIDNNLPDIAEEVCEEIVCICDNSLISIYKQKGPIGKVYLDEALKNYLVPFSQRSANKSVKAVVRGSKLDVAESMKTIRTFLYWKDGSKDWGTDIDLSAVMYDEAWGYLEHVSYTNLRSAKYKSSHSGDITSAPAGASEFIDLDIQSVRNFGGRYIVFSIHSFSGEAFNELPECFMGWMSRENPNSGEIYEPKTVENRMDITSDSKICIPMILDLQDNKIIWTDVALRTDPYFANNVEENQMGMVLMGKALTSLVKPNLYDLFKLHIEARGEFCATIEEADLIFSVDKGITPFNLDLIVSEYL
ncbi:TerD family protein [Niallia sp. MER 6]|uniref:TerD family protein n=1 Tax=Niallia sp. MER 6 TaxID=2939567 RepID=UPI00203B9A8D|nr:TerD family protein [Niallia sp. MER 6]MCM3032134.1 TerD family protein [Niallia sp. MER 6]